MSPDMPPMNQQDQLLERPIQVQNDDQLSEETRASSVIGSIGDTADILDAASVVETAEIPLPAVARIEEDKPAVSEDDHQVSDRQRACDEAALQDIETVDSPQVDPSFSSATKQQKDQDDSSSLSELELLEPAIPSRDRTPEDTLHHGYDVDEESNTRSSSEDAIVQDSQPVYNGRPIGSSSPIDVPYQDDILEHSSPVCQAGEKPAQSEPEISHNATTDNGVIGEIHGILARVDASVPLNDVPPNQAYMQDDADAVPSSSPEASHAEQWDEQISCMILSANAPPSRTGYETVEEGVSNDQKGSPNDPSLNDVKENAAAVYVEGVQSAALQQGAIEEIQSTLEKDSMLRNSAPSLDSMTDGLGQTHHPENEAAIESCNLTTLGENPETAEERMPTGKEILETAALSELQQSLEPLQSITTNQPLKNVFASGEIDVLHSKPHHLNFTASIPGSVKGSELSSNSAGMDADIETSSSVADAQEDQEVPSTLQTASHRDTLKRINSQPTVVEQELNAKSLAVERSHSQQDIPSDCPTVAVTIADRLSSKSAADLPGLPSLPIVGSTDRSNSENAMPEDKIAPVVEEEDRKDPAEEDGRDEILRSDQAMEDTQDIRDNSERECSSDAPVVGTASNNGAAEDAETTLSTTEAADLAEPSITRSTTHDTPLKRAVQPVDGSSTPSNVSTLHRDSTKGQTYVGGMLASNKAMRPFRSPMIARKEALTSSDNASTSSTTKQSLTPSKASITNGPKGLHGRRSMLSSSTISHGMNASSPVTSSARAPAKTLHTSMKTGLAGNVALNKPFKSLFSKPTGEQAIVSDASAGSAPEMIDINGKPMSIFQLSTSLHGLERRLALLKDAKRHRIARERGLDSADNTDHIRELSAKWLEKGREAAELLWELVKDNMEAQDDNQHGDSGFGGGFGNDKNQSNWGWDTSEEPAKAKSGRPRRQHGRTSWQATNMVERLREKVSIAIDELPEDERQALYKQVEAEGTLPDLDPDMIIEKQRGKRSLAGGRDRPSKKARLDSDAGATDNDDKQHDTNEEVGSTSESESEEQPRSQHKEVEDSDALSDVAHDEEEKPSSSQDEEEEMDAEEDPNGRGMAKMLMSCGIDTKTFGWDAGKEDWDEVKGQP